MSARHFALFMFVTFATASTVAAAAPGQFGDANATRCPRWTAAFFSVMQMLLSDLTHATPTSTSYPNRVRSEAPPVNTCPDSDAVTSPTGSGVGETSGVASDKGAREETACACDGGSGGCSDGSEPRVQATRTRATAAPMHARRIRRIPLVTVFSLSRLTLLLSCGARTRSRTRHGPPARRQLQPAVRPNRDYHQKSPSVCDQRYL